MRKSVHNVELFYSDLVDLVQNVKARYVCPVALHGVNELVHCARLLDYNVCASHSVFHTDLADGFVVEVGARFQLLNIEPAFVFLSDCYFRRPLIESDSEPFQLLFDYLLVRHRVGRRLR